MADVKLNSLATKTNANAAAILVKDSATQNAGAEGWITKAQLNQIIRDEIKAQMSAITSGTPDVPVLDGSTLKYMTLANFAKVAGEQGSIMPIVDLSFGGDCDSITNYGFYRLNESATNKQGGLGSWLLNLPHPNPNQYGTQWIFARGGNSMMYMREKTAGTWGAWRYVNFTLGS